MRLINSVKLKNMSINKIERIIEETKTSNLTIAEKDANIQLLEQDKQFKLQKARNSLVTVS